MKIFEKYPDSEADYSILEAAVAEVKKNEIGASSSYKDSIIESESGKKGKKKQEDEEMKRYMEELKRKEEEVSAKVDI
jgi:hypothetical protein